MKLFKKAISLLLLTVLCFSLTLSAGALEIKEPKLEINAKSAVLMDANTGTLLFEYNKDERLAPASVTKIMTLLIVFEALDNGTLKYDDMLTVSEHAASMGGSQIFLEPNETMSVNDLLKSVVVASANDAALTLAEHIAGSEESFVEMMNKHAKELGMENTHFENPTGLDDDVVDHMTTAYDIALMSRELLKHEKITEFSTIWMDTVRNGEFGLTNTNRLVRFYKGITGLKTGSTSKAGFCVSATAKRNGMHLIAVIMGSETSETRNASAAKLLDFGFANYSIYKNDSSTYKNVKVLGGEKDYVGTKFDGYETLMNKGNENKVTFDITVNDSVSAPVKAGDIVGKVVYKCGDEILGEKDVYAIESVEKITFGNYIYRIFRNFFLK